MRQSVGSMAQLTIKKEAFGGEQMRNALFDQRRKSEMDRGLCGQRDHCGKKARSRRRDPNYARAGSYEEC